MVSTQQIETVLSGIRPFLQADGVNIEVISTEGNSAIAHLTLPADSSPAVLLSLWSGIEEGLRAHIPEFDSLRLS